MVAALQKFGPTELLDVYWRFAHERQEMYLRRLAGSDWPWTSDPILRDHRFTNVYRASDRVSQYLIANVQYGGPQTAQDLVLRTLLFKFFNRIGTWQALEEAVGVIEAASLDWSALEHVLDIRQSKNERLYSAAYIMPPTRLEDSGCKHRGHLLLLRRIMEDGLPARVENSRSLREVYEMLLTYPSVGPFLAMQFAIDLNYSALLDHSESEFICAGPGAKDGISKVFSRASESDAAAVIWAMYEAQEDEFARLGLPFSGLWGRPLQLIDLQNVFCEVSKYSRASHPHVKGRAGRDRIKQTYVDSGLAMPQPYFPPRWNLRPELAVAFA